MTLSEIGIVNKLQYYIVKKIKGFLRKTGSDISESMVGCYKLFSDVKSTTRNIFVRRYMQFVTEKLSSSD